MFPAYTNPTIYLYEDPHQQLIYYTDDTYTWWIPIYDTAFGQALYDIQDWLNGYQPLGITTQKLDTRHLTYIARWTHKKGLILITHPDHQPAATDLALNYTGHHQPLTNHNYSYSHHY